MLPVEICNLALLSLNQDTTISDLNSSSDPNARVCRRFYDISRQLLLKDFYWPFAKKRATLDLIDNEIEREWPVRYRYPNDCLNIIKISSGLIYDTEDTEVIYEVENHNNKKIIVTRGEYEELVYIADVEDTRLFTQEFSMALAYLIASKIAPTVVSANRMEAVEISLAKYEMYLNKGRMNSLNERHTKDMITDEFIRARY